MAIEHNAESYTINGRELVCIICKGKNFHHQKTMMNTSGLTFFGIEWLNDEAENYVCDSCGYVHWFLNE
jgi:hypothetical protein